MVKWKRGNTEQPSCTTHETTLLRKPLPSLADLTACPQGLNDRETAVLNIGDADFCPDKR